jgi:ATP-binding cassette subfamily B protein
MAIAAIGKSTALSLLYRAFDPQEGSILVDDVDIRDFTLSSLRRHISVVFQETSILNRSVKENLIIADDSASDSDLYTALESAQAMDFMLKKGDGLEYSLGENGRHLSGGQKQRVSIARAFLKKQSSILILDESTSSLDSHTEKKVLEALENISSDRTTFIIAHRLATIQKAHKVLVFSNGSIAEEGTFRTLYHQGGLFTKLVDAQSFTIPLGGPSA